MKQCIILFGALCLFLTSAIAQNNVGIGTTTPNASAALDVQSTTQGMLVPRMTSAQRTAIASPANGLLVYQTDGTAGFYFYNGSAWTSLNSGGSSGDNLGNHTATQALNMANNNITNVNTITSSKMNLNEIIFPNLNTGAITTTASTVNSTILDATGKSYIKLTGPSGASIIGMAGGVDGKVVHLLINTGSNTLAYNSTSESCSSCRFTNAILTVGSTTGPYVATFIYDQSQNVGDGRWVLINFTN